MSVPHALSLSRIVAAPVIVALLFTSNPDWLLLAAAVFALASLTDLLDGSLARRSSDVGVVGVYLDTTADKVLVSLVLIGLALAHLVDGWVPMVIVAREFLISGLRSMAAARGQVISANYAGKVKTTVTMLAIVAVLLAGNALRGGALRPIGNHAVLIAIDWWAMALAVALTIVSGWGYVRAAAPSVVEPARVARTDGSGRTEEDSSVASRVRADGVG